MSEECTHDCSSCKEECADRSAPQKEKIHQGSSVKKVIAVLSGKGGVGKSLVTSLLAVSAARKGYKTGIMDLDITGPSIPKAFGITQKAGASQDGILPVSSAGGIKVMSINLLLNSETDPVIWRGPIIAGVAKQFWTDVAWGDLDYMFIDMPPGTGDVALTAFQSLPLDGVVIVTSPQSLVSMVVEKAVNMASMMSVPVLGMVENMSYVICPDCGKKIEIFGKSNAHETASRHGLSMLGTIPMQPELSEACDRGAIEYFKGGWLDELSASLEKL